MIDYINYYYDLYPSCINELNNSFLFYIGNIKYCFAIYNRNIDELEDIITLNKIMLERGLLVHEIVINKFGKPLVQFSNYQYILFKVIVEDKTIELDDIFYFANNTENILLDSISRTNWKQLWETKIDYFEYQMLHVLKKYPLLNNTMDYYIGLSENALEYLNYINMELGSICVCHKRLGVNSNLFDLYNPLNLIVDYKVRDISEYLKDSYFNDINCNVIINKIFNRYIFDRTNLLLFITRLLFPSYYFDLFEDIVNKDLDENIIFQIMKKSSSYEDFVSKLIINCGLLNISWLIH